MNRKNCFVAFLLTSLMVATANAAAPAFPTAEGYGRNATGGRGGKVVEVTNLLDDANGTTEGSFRWALKQYSTSPLTVVFRVSGLIQLVADIRCSRTAGTTIAGQTAPGDGICIRGGKCNFGGSSNLVIRHMRFRIGLKGDTAFLAGGSVGIENSSNWIVDHCTFGWSGEENMTIYDNNNTTIQWCLLHEGLYACGHAKGARSYAAQWGGQTATFHHNLLAHNNNRTPRFNGARSNDLDVLVDYVNNVVYNWGKPNSCYGGDITNKAHRANLVNNYYKPGPARPGSEDSYFVQSSYLSTQGTAKV
ncbi:MAG: Por secretion system protein, partial [Bacteroidota bacterium]|nr:Por secretion system protein [Bacteroidota bacterium]